MRLGTNPAKQNPSIEARHYHRIVVPVYIPAQEGFFEESLEVLRLCLETLTGTVHASAAVTVVNNGSCPEVRTYLNALFEAGHLDQVVHHHENVGKIDALFGVIRATHEPLVTIADADALFEPGWIEAVEQALAAVPEIGMISPCPVPAVWQHRNSATLLSGFFGFRRRFVPVLSRDQIERFPQSIGSQKLYQHRMPLMERQLALESGGTRLLLGCGHFVATMRREVFARAPRQAARMRIGAKSMAAYVDDPVDRAGFLRVGTDRILAHHMGNVPEPWMHEVLARVQATPAPEPPLQTVPPPRRPLGGRVPYTLRRHLNQVLRVPFVRRSLLRFWGVPGSLSFK